MTRRQSRRIISKEKRRRGEKVLFSCASTVQADMGQVLSKHTRETIGLRIRGPSKGVTELHNFVCALRSNIESRGASAREVF